MNNLFTNDSVGAMMPILTRRRLLALAGGATVLAASAPGAVAAMQDASAAATPAVATGAGLPIPSTLAGDASPEFRAVADALVDAMQRNRVPGVALGIMAGDREEHATFGVASVASMAPVTAETLFQIGSLTKTFTATAIWHLHDRGALAIDTPVRSLLPDLRTADPAVAEAVQVGNLLDHSAGWYGDEGFETGSGDDALARYIAERLPELPQQFPLGEFFSYNNAGFSLLGRLIEVTTGTTYEAAMQELVCGPLGLADTILDREAVMRRPYADGHYAGPINGRDMVAVQTPLWIPRSVDPAGGFWSTTRDIIRYARFHLAASTTISAPTNVVSPESLLQMQEPVINVPGLPISMGRDWFVQETDGVKVIIHNGDTTGQHTEFFAIPEHNLAFVLLTNGSGGALTALEIVDIVLATYPGLSGLVGKLGLNRVGLAPADTATVDLPQDVLDEYAGHYADLASDYQVTVQDSGLLVQVKTSEEPGTLQPAIAPSPAPDFPVRFEAKDAGLAGGVLRMPFVRDDEGKVGWLSSGLRLIPRVD